MATEASSTTNEGGCGGRPTPVKNEVRITQQGKTRMYISHGHSLLTEKGADSIVIKAVGRALNKAVTAAEILKRRIEGLHQIADISSMEVVDVQQQQKQQQQQREDGESEEQPKKITRRVSVITITLSFSPLDTSHIGYQPPLPPEELNPGGGERSANKSRAGERGGSGAGRGRGRGGRKISGPGRDWQRRPAEALGADAWNDGRGQGQAQGLIQNAPHLPAHVPASPVTANQQPWPYQPGYGHNFGQGYGQHMQMQGFVQQGPRPAFFGPPAQGVGYAVGQQHIPGPAYQALAANTGYHAQTYPQAYARGGAGYSAPTGMYTVATPSNYTAVHGGIHPGAYGGVQYQGVVAHGSAQNVSFARGRGGVFMGAGGSGQGGMWRNDAAFQGAKDHLPPHMQQEFIPRR